jgi:hypothetical protein
MFASSLFFGDVMMRMKISSQIRNQYSKKYHMMNSAIIRAAMIRREKTAQPQPKAILEVDLKAAR